MPMQVNVKDIQKALRNMGFKLTDRGRSKVNYDCQIYERTYTEQECRVIVQLWGDGKHRASMAHVNLALEMTDPTWKRNNDNPYTHETTLPIDFATVDEVEEVVNQARFSWLEIEKEVETRYAKDFLEHGHREEHPSRDEIRSQILAEREQSHLSVANPPGDKPEVDGPDHDSPQ